MCGSRAAVRPVPLRAALLIEAPPERVRVAAIAIPTWVRATTAVGGSVAVAGHAGHDDGLVPGQLLRFAAGHGRHALFRVDRPGHAHGADEVLRMTGVGRYAGWIVAVTAATTLAGSLVTVDVRPGRHRLAGRARVLRGAQLLLGVILLAAQATPAVATARGQVLGDAGTPGTVAALARQSGGAAAVVVAGVLVRDGAVLAARRTYPPELAGRWECPGGKVEPGEAEKDALVRELGEELGITVEVGERVGPDCDIGGGHVLHAYRAGIVAGEPSPTVHDAIRWLTAGEIDSVRWLSSDAPLVPALRDLLGHEDGARRTRSAGP